MKNVRDRTRRKRRRAHEAWRYAEVKPKKMLLLGKIQDC